METRWFVWDRRGRIAERYYGSTLKKKKRKGNTWGKFIVPRFNCENNSYAYQWGTPRIWNVNACCLAIDVIVTRWMMHRHLNICVSMFKDSPEFTEPRSRCGMSRSDVPDERFVFRGISLRHVNLNRFSPSCVQIYIHQPLVLPRTSTIFCPKIATFSQF